MLGIKKKVLGLQAAVMTGALLASSSPASASNVVFGGGGSNDFGNIAENITDSISQLPGLLTGVAYMFGILLGVLGVLKVKDHVENPSNTPLKEGAIRMASGGALFALPIVYEAMRNTIGAGSGVSAAELNHVLFNVR